MTLLESVEKKKTIKYITKCLDLSESPKNIGKVCFQKHEDWKYQQVIYIHGILKVVDSKR